MDGTDNSRRTDKKRRLLRQIMSACAYGIPKGIGRCTAQSPWTRLPQFCPYRARRWHGSASRDAGVSDPDRGVQGKAHKHHREGRVSRQGRNDLGNSDTQDVQRCIRGALYNQRSAAEIHLRHGSKHRDDFIGRSIVHA